MGQFCFHPDKGPTHARILTSSPLSEAVLDVVLSSVLTKCLLHNLNELPTVHEMHERVHSHKAASEFKKLSSLTQPS